MATKRSQRIGIWVIAIVMGVGSLGVYFVAILANNNNAKDKQSQQAEIADYQAKVQKQADDLSAKYYSTFAPYASEVSSFDAKSVTSLATTDLKEGDGATIGSNTSYSAYYIGWNPSGKVFDESISGGKLKAPLDVSENAGVIEGWSKGMIGAKIGGVRELTIPAAQAYGSAGQGPDIPANTPLKFVVMTIPEVAPIPVPADLQNLQQ